MPEKKGKKETLDEKLNKIEHTLHFKGKKVKWEDVKNLTIDEFQSSPDFEGDLPKEWQENMKPDV